VQQVCPTLPRPSAAPTWTFCASALSSTQDHPENIPRRSRGLAAVGALGSAGLLVGLYSSRHSGVGTPLSFGAFAAIYVLMTRWAWIEGKFFLKLNEAAKQSPRN
jgi:hypothetical protein